MRHDLKASNTYTFIVVSALSLVKSSASFFATLILIYYLYESFKNLYEQEGKLISILLIISTSDLAFMPIWIWNGYVKANFPITKYELSVSSYQKIF